jgi:phage FluMu protein Com
MARTDWTDKGWTNPVKMKCPKCKTVYSVSGKDAREAVGCKNPECKGEQLYRA